MLKIIETAFRADIPTLLWGDPGVGKTAALLDFAESRKIHVEVLIGSTMDPTDLGYLLPEKGALKIAPPPWASRLKGALDAGKDTLLFLDEFSCAPPSLQAALLRLVNERRVGDLDLGPPNSTRKYGVRIMAAANPPDQAAGGWDLAAAAANRWMHLNWSVDLSDWCTGMLTNWGKPISDAERDARVLVVGFVRAGGTARLIKPPKRGEPSSSAWPSPRTWDKVARLLSTINADPRAAMATEIALVGIEGLVGSGVAGEFSEWFTKSDLPDPEELLKGAPLPTRGDILAMSLDGVVAAVLGDHPDRINRIQKAIEILTDVRPDVALVAVSTLASQLTTERKLVDFRPLAEVLNRVKAP